MNDKQREEKENAKKALSKLAWSMARVMTKRTVSSADRNKHVWCPTCKQGFCLGFDGIDQFCRDCFYKPYEIDGQHAGCIKECEGSRVCQHCEEEKHAKERKAQRRKDTLLLRLQKKYTLRRSGHRRR